MTIGHDSVKGSRRVKLNGRVLWVYAQRTSVRWPKEVLFCHEKSKWKAERSWVESQLYFASRFVATVNGHAVLTNTLWHKTVGMIRVD